MDIPEVSAPRIPEFLVPNVPDFRSPIIPEFMVSHGPEFGVRNMPETMVPAVPNFAVPNVPDFNGPSVPNFAVPNIPDFANFVVPNAHDFTREVFSNFAVPNAPDFTGEAAPNFAVPNAPDFNGPPVPNFVGEESKPLEQLLLDLELQKTHNAPRSPLVVPFTLNSFDTNSEAVPINPFVNNNNQLPPTAINPFMIKSQSRNPFMTNNQSPDLFMANNQSPQILDTFAPPINPFVFLKMQGFSPVYGGPQIFNSMPFQLQAANGYETDHSEPQLSNGPVHGNDIVNPHASEASDARGLHHAVTGRVIDVSNQEMFNEETEKFQDYNPVPVTSPFTQMDVVQGPHDRLDFDGSYNALDQPVPFFY
ncbi:uncharacterized protein LOC119594397 [Penaeus monodon]|uniref:uncharacterized protein LOC119594397 n=1 Tax=Penaeus monodon TaxID=6687 RepID=UPI0018A7A934|nr:uncharacterized protein LOC119594397 [Penaeus monodon]